MKVKILGSLVKNYEEVANGWFAENKDLEIKHVAMTVIVLDPLNSDNPFLASVIFYEEKDQSRKARRLDE
jgi:hypothetical protein